MTARRLSLLRFTSLTLLGALATGSILFSDPAPVQAQFGIINGLLGGGFGGGYYYHRHSYRHHYYAGGGGRHRSRSEPSDDSSEPSQSESTHALASLAPPSSREQLAVLKSVYPSDVLGAVGSSDDNELTGQAGSSEVDRDYTTKVDALIENLKSQQKNSDKQGDVTEHAILDSLTEAILQAKLQKFETFLGENWSAERLRGMIIDRVNNEIGGLFDGTNNGAVSMSDIDSMIKKGARDVYTRLFETSELLAANRGSTLFVQRLYQTHGDLVGTDTREDTEELLLKASAAGIAPFESLFRREPDAYALRYRAQRIIFDCLSDNIETITASRSGMATTAQIEKRLLDVDKKQCTKWVSAQMSGPDGKLKAQDPMPLRVIWSADGPRDDPSMYGHASDS